MLSCSIQENNLFCFDFVFKPNPIHLLSRSKLFFLIQKSWILEQLNAARRQKQKSKKGFYVRKKLLLDSTRRLKLVQLTLADPEASIGLVLYRIGSRVWCPNKFIHLLKFCQFFPVPSGPPENVHCQSRGPNSILLEWSKPKREHRNGIIRGYWLQYYPRVLWYGKCGPLGWMQQICRFSKRFTC